jgi:NAD(P)-dependent dehydrogenase (short-subunit alcohol dehydrogenase family)
MREKTMVITGGTRGLGRALAEEGIANEYHVIICARDRGEVDAVAAEVGATPYAVDITREDDLGAFIRFIVEQYGAIDVWINNAGVWIPHTPVEELSLDRVRAIFEINVFGTILCSKHALTQMRHQSAGTIVNIISVSALTGHALSSGYAASKWAIRGFTESLRAECAHSKVRIVSVYPGPMQTGLFDEQPPADFDTYLLPAYVAKKIIKNLALKNPKKELTITSSPTRSAR